ncbi:amidase [Ruixingdingia sedimenti]|uniref:Amidase family protein n=1 Tax=Ruixingdingia sedimenti TaxID=3073604 RepID=A0ABU1F6A6_9RHOB|nr:amidase family protein [Xinfangfangia sp. LG-4]MDR5652407.1 amidase family protein [Xinfangfangia sp. LG-4]
MRANWLTMTAGDLGRAIGAGQIHPVELAEAFLDAIAAHPDTPRIYARTTPERARDEAMAAAERAKMGLRRGLLDGVPISWKDNIDTAGVATEAGSALLAGRVPAADAPVLRAATFAGLVCLGKTHLSELAFSGLGLNPVTATPPNVNDPAAVPGGSSSGAAASVAFGLAAAAIGTDTGGSIRIPPAWNDLVGFKPTRGRLPGAGVVPLANSFDTVGPMGRSVEDCALLLAAMGGGRPADLRGAGLAGRRLLVLETVALDDLSPAPAQAFDAAVSCLTAAGARVDRLRFPGVAEALGLAATLVAPEAYGLWQDTIEAAPDKMFPLILDRFRTGAAIKATDFVAAWRRLHVLRAQWAAAVAGADAVILPTTPNLPPDAARLLRDADYYTQENARALRNTRIGNLFEGAALTLPTGVASCGIMFLTLPEAEERLLRLGAAAEPVLRRG